MLQLGDSDEYRPTLPDWFLSNFVATRQSLETLKPLVSLIDPDDDDASKHKSSAPDTTPLTPHESEIYQIESHVYNNLLALAKPSEHFSSSRTARFDYDVLALRLPGQIKQPPGLDFLAAVAKHIAKDIGADFIHLDYDVLQAIKPYHQTMSETGRDQSQQPLMRQGRLGKPLSSATKFKWADYFHEVLSVPKLHGRRELPKGLLEPRALVVAFTDLWRKTRDEGQEKQQEEIRRAFGESVRSFITRDYPVLVVAIDVPAPSANTSQSMDFHFRHTFELENQSVKAREYERRYDLLDQIGHRSFRQPIEICPVPSQTQRQLLKRDQERKVARENIRRIQLYAKRSPICATSRLLEPPSEWEFLRPTAAYKALSDPDLSNNQVVSIASQLRMDCSEYNVRRVVSSALAWSQCLNSWTDERESRRAEEVETDQKDQATSKDSQDPASRQPNKTREVIDRIKKDKEEFQWEYELIDSIIEPGQFVPCPTYAV